MNKAYKVVYNESTGTYVAVSELETSKGKATSISDNSTVVQTDTPKSLTGRFVLGKLALTVLGLSTLFAMPLAHASWTNNATGGSSATNGTYGSSSADGIAIGTGTGGNKAFATGANSIAIGSMATASNQYSVAIGRVSTASAENSTAFGNNSTANGISAVAVGSSSIASGIGALAVGNDAQATGNNSTAVGAGNNDSRLNAARAQGVASTALGFSHWLQAITLWP